MLLRALKSLLLAGGVVLAVPAGAQDVAAVADPRPTLGLMGTIPIYWGETDGLADLLSGEGDAHWARARLEQQWRLQPVDHLDPASLGQFDRLLLAQPRALSAPENVALDTWVRGGGRLLIFADPMMTGESRFGIGDRRRPQDVILLSPILRHWGLDLRFDENQSAGTELRDFAGTALPIRLAGSFAPLDPAGVCVLEAAEILASCTIGQGQVVVLADAAMLDLHHPQPQSADALDALVRRAFVGHGESAGMIVQPAENQGFGATSGASAAPDMAHFEHEHRKASD